MTRPAIALTFGVLAIIAIALILPPPALAFKPYQSRIPNGDIVPHPCMEGETWHGVGHEVPRGGGVRNAFGKDFTEIGGRKWTVRLCKMDSDGDGQSNGEELGDPDCYWAENTQPKRMSNITHPGICTPYDSPLCEGRDKFVSCEKPALPRELDCENPNRTEIIPIDLTIPWSKVPNRETSYVCYTFKAPLDGESYMVGMKPIINNTNIMHHIIIYGCPDSTPLIDEPEDCTMGAGCTDIIGLWAISFSGLCLPTNVGFQFGTGGYSKIKFEFHWNNPEFLDDQYDASGMRLFFERASPAMISAGVLVTGQSLLQIPGGQSFFEQNGTCDSKCSAILFKEPINFFGGANHMHYIGVSQSTSLWRDGKMIKGVAYDDPASFNNPVYHKFDTPIVMKPGDTLLTRCIYDSTKRQRTTYYGQATSDEMCYFFGFFYPRENVYSPYCVQTGPLSQCNRNARVPLGDCDWWPFIKGVLTQSLPIALDLRLNCITTGQCQPECQHVVNQLKKHPCMQDDKILYLATMLQGHLEGANFLARYSSCGDGCPVWPPTLPLDDSSGSVTVTVRPVWSCHVMVMMTVAVTLLLTALV